jgi:hypothetical protein
MLISHELPKQLLPYHRLINDYPYILGHLISIDKEYANFYKQVIKDHTYSIFDNSAFELGKAIDSKELFDLAIEYKPSHLVLPDTLHDYKQTLERSLDFVKRYKSGLERANITLMGVLQGNSFEELYECFGKYRQNGINNIAIPFDCIKNSDWHTVRAIFFKEFCEQYEWAGNIHFLGITNPSELLLYTEEEKERIFSIDTSSPIVNGWVGNEYGEYGLFGEKPKVKLADSLNIKLSDEQINRINKNVKMFRNYAER